MTAERPALAPEAATLPSRPFYRTAKRAFDLAVSGASLLVVSPVLLLAAILVRLSSPGPIFFVQQRMGRGFKPFGIYKFRTMVADAERLGGQITAGADPRITRVGHWLRRTKIDELPQLFNILGGKMSLVGPRPEVPRYVELFREDYAHLLAVRPGLTDPASIKYRNEAELLAASADPQQEYVSHILPDKIAISRAYIAQATLWSDLAVLVRTVLG